jgi:hypothetical protein
MSCQTSAIAMSRAEQMEVVQNPALEAAQAEFFAGTVDYDGARTLLGDGSKPCSLRTLERFVADGLPHVKYGAKRRFVVARMREWMLARERSRSRAPRAPGRPSRKPDPQHLKRRTADAATPPPP